MLAVKKTTSFSNIYPSLRSDIYLKQTSCLPENFLENTEGKKNLLPAERAWEQKDNRRKKR